MKKLEFVVTRLKLDSFLLKIFCCILLLSVLIVPSISFAQKKRGHKKSLKTSSAKKVNHASTHSSPDQPAEVPSGILDMLNSLSNAENIPTLGSVEVSKNPPTTSSRTLKNEDFGAPPAEEMREKLDKKAKEQQVANEEEWRESVKTTRTQLEEAKQLDKNTPSAIPENNNEDNEKLALDKSISQAKVRATQEKLDKLLSQGKDKGYKELEVVPEQNQPENP